MKKVLLSVLLAGVATLANAQKSEIAEAEKSWNLFQVSLSMKSGTDLTKQLASLTTGLTHTDKAIANEKTKDSPKAWAYKALFSSAIAVLDTVNVQNATTYQKNAVEAIAKAKSLDTKNEEKANIETAQINVTNATRGKAVRAYKAKDYNGALVLFNELLAVDPTDTAMYINAGVTAKLAEKYPEAIQHFKKVISYNVPESKDFYTEIINMNTDKLKDTAAALAVIKEALVKFPDDPGLIGAETDLYIAKGDITKSQESLGKLIAKDSKNAIYQYLMGDTYYKQALGVQETRKKLDPKKIKEYDALGIKMTALIDQSLPFYKKANELNPTYRPALETLKQIYAFKSDTAGYNDIKKKLDALPEDATTKQ